MHSSSNSHPLFLIRLFLAAAGGTALLLACSSSSSSATDGGPSGPRTTLGCIIASGKCDCTLSTSGSTTDACSAASVGSPSICCAEDAYLSNGNGACSCAAFACATTIVNGATDCECTRGGASGTNVAKCTPEGSNVCCLSVASDRCFCNVTATVCQTGQGSVVDDCSVDRLKKTCDTYFPGLHNPLTDCRSGK
jgi:hypothetical protein